MESDNMTDKQNVSAVGADDVAAAQKLREAGERIRAELRKVIIGQDRVVEELLIALFAGGHCILEGVPGLAKTLMISTLARSLSLSFSRIQFTPDLMPSDITGTEVIQEDRASGTRAFKFLRGPVFANVVLADEINRTPPKTQAALLEAMQERQVTVGRARHLLPELFFVLATQNPIEQEGTYPLPEAQQDRFMFKIFVRYPSFDEELEIARRTTTSAPAQVDQVLSADDILQAQELIRRTPAADSVIRYVLALVRQTRATEPGCPDYVRKWLSWGAGPRAVQYLLLASKARALLQGRSHATVDDAAAMALPVLRHRLVTSYAAEADGLTADKVVERILAETPRREDELSRDSRFAAILGS
jgi:MoxR-like ATPase